MKRQKRKHSPEFEAQVALEAIKGERTLSEIARGFEIHPVMIGKRKKEMLENLPDIFAKKHPKKNSNEEREKAQLHQKVGQLSMELDFLEKKCKQLGIPVRGRNS